MFSTYIQLWFSVTNFSWYDDIITSQCTMYMCEHMYYESVLPHAAVKVVSRLTDIITRHFLSSLFTHASAVTDLEQFL